VPPIISQHADDVAEVLALPDYRLFVRFFDGTEGIVEMRNQIFCDRAGAFASLRDIASFERVGIGFGAVMWEGDLDLAPDAMYDEFKRNGVWIVS
jgi:hypothetical protein